MTWALIRDSDNAWLSPPEGEVSKPAPGAGEHVIEVVLGFPDSAIWSADRNGFIDVLSADGFLAKIDADAGEARAKYITVAPGQEMTYQRKEREARAYVADTAPDTANYPFLVAEAAALDITIAAAAAEIINAADQWAVIGSEIERLRMAGKRAVAAAADYPARAAAATIVWP